MFEMIMDYRNQIIEINKKIQVLKKVADELLIQGEDFPSLYRNSRRILASTKMLELNISDIKNLKD